MGQLLQQHQQPIAISSVQRQPVPVVQKPVAAVAPQPAAPTGGVHVIRTAGQQNAPKSFKNVQELQQWLQQNPQVISYIHTWCYLVYHVVWWHYFYPNVRQVIVGHAESPHHQ